MNFCELILQQLFANIWASNNILGLSSETDSSTSNISCTMKMNSKKKKVKRIKANPNKPDRTLIKFIRMNEEFWKTDRGWICHFCQAEFKFEIAFKSHLKKKNECNQVIICLECKKVLKLADLKNHVLIHSPKSRGGCAVLQEYYLKSLAAK